LGRPRARIAHVFWPLVDELAEKTTQEIPGAPVPGRPVLQTMFPDGIAKPNQLTGFAADPAGVAAVRTSAEPAIASNTAPTRVIVGP
jgi:hypothetical protein